VNYFTDLAKSLSDFGPVHRWGQRTDTGPGAVEGVASQSRLLMARPPISRGFRKLMKALASGDSRDSFGC
jgi:hypothetical protein